MTVRALSTAYRRAGRIADAIQAARRALDLAVRDKNEELTRNLPVRVVSP
jgi:hypothetical protein